MTVASILRNETRPEHVRTEASFAGFDLGSHTGYARFLIAQASAFLAVERSLERSGASRLIEDWADRRRGDLLLKDLAQLNVGAVRLQPPLPFEAEAEVLGGVYVIEGSRLGGKILRNRIPHKAPQRFISADGEPGAWRNFLGSLDRRLPRQGDIRLAVDAARRVFSSFETAARETVELCVER